MLQGFLPGVRVYIDFPLQRVYGSVVFGPSGSHPLWVYVQFDNGNFQEFRPGSTGFQMLKKVQGG
jgi:hypothetical protein